MVVSLLINSLLQVTIADFTYSLLMHCSSLHFSAKN